MGAEPLEEISSFYGSKRLVPVLGTDQFKGWIRGKGYARAKGREVPEARHLAVSLGDCVKAVAEMFGVREKAIWAGRRGSLNEPRQLAMVACREIGGYSLKRIAEAMGVASYSTVSSVCSTMKKRMMKDERLRKRLNQIGKTLSANLLWPLSDLTPS